MSRIPNWLKITFICLIFLGTCVVDDPVQDQRVAASYAQR